MSEALPSSEVCQRCKQCDTSANSTKDCYMNGEVGCSSDITCASTPPADESQSCECNRNDLNCEPSESHPGQITDGLQKTCTVTSEDCVQRAVADNSISSRHFISEVQSQSQKLTNGTDESCSATDERFSSCKAVERNAEPVSDDAVSETAKLCQSPDDTSCVSESTRLNILDAAETFASIIGREIAASFDLKEGELSSLESRGSSGAGCSFSLTQCSTARVTGSSNSPRTLQVGLKLLGEDRKCESDRGPPLDTVEVARRVRDILTANNVGQRQFARYVLGLSQGTVSELLAKPKPWDRLTEKGKESYRRMNQWAGDHLGVASLKGHLNSVALKANLPSSKGSHSSFYALILEASVAGNLL